VQIVVLGMHRSGTSAATRLLNMMGAYFGPASISTGLSWENPTGFWERRDVRQICDGVLHACGVDWWRPARFLPEEVPGLVRRQALERWQAVAEDLEAYRPWVVKEPRLCLLLPVLRPALDAPVALHVHREPLEVAASLRHRNHFPLHVGLALWEFYTVSALNASRDMPSVHVWYGDLLADAGGELARIHAALVDAGVTGLTLPDDAEVGAFLTEDLHRQREQVEAHQGRLSLAQAELLKTLRDPDAAARDALKVSPGTLDVLMAFEEAEQTRTTLEADLRSAEAERNERDRQLQELEQDLTSAQAARAGAALRTEALDAAVQELRAKQAESMHRAQSLEARLQKATRDYARLRGRRSVRASLALANHARPVFRLVRRLRSS
jgi:hypothetical protein